jgi:hypothetical protein
MEGNEGRERGRDYRSQRTVSAAKLNSESPSTEMNNGAEKEIDGSWLRKCLGPACAIFSGTCM